uniref:Trans-golgi network protein 2 n=1 Tax=Sinocyclocheilus anshuiensis TaxID=1608454 RepID=A0A671KF04_9TELE
SNDVDTSNNNDPDYKIGEKPNEEQKNPSASNKESNKEIAPQTPEETQSKNNEANNEKSQTLTEGVNENTPLENANKDEGEDETDGKSEEKSPGPEIPTDEDVQNGDSANDPEEGEGEGEDTVDEPSNEQDTFNSKTEKKENKVKAYQQEESAENSHFFAYLVCAVILVAVLYIASHNKRKIIAFVFEGRRSRGTRRPKSSDYHKLDQSVSSITYTHSELRLLSIPFILKYLKNT